MNTACVVGSTCSMLNATYLQGVSFPFMVLDEASQATEPESVASLNKLQTGGHAVLVGDHLQLSCFCNSQPAADAGLQTSLFERLMLCPYITRSLLNIQYRMVPSISKWPNERFYEGLLNDAWGGRTECPPRGFPWANTSVAFVHVPEAEQVSRNKIFLTKLRVT